MKVCGVEIKGSEAVISLLSWSDDLINCLDCRVRKITFNKSNSTEDIRAFQFGFSKLMDDYQIEKVVIKERPHKGKFAGGAIGFKLEAAIQLIDSLDVELMSAQGLKASLKRNPLHIAFSETGLKVFQEGAFTTAFAYLMNCQYPPKDDV